MVIPVTALQAEKACKSEETKEAPLAFVAIIIIVGGDGCCTHVGACRCALSVCWSYGGERNGGTQHQQVVWLCHSSSC
jgi:hypothetical protein